MRRACAMLIGTCLATGGAMSTATATARPVLRVCADPNNLPFSNRQLQGFENKIAERLARALDADLAYTWWAQRRGFVRNTLRAGTCDVVMGAPVAWEMVAHTEPYYRLSYVFVRRAGQPVIRSFDDPALRRLRIGIPLVGDDGANPPPEHALARRGLVDNVVGYSVYGDYARPDPPMALMRALEHGEIDVAVVWGPLAGYIGRRQRRGLIATPVSPASDDGVPFVFDIALGVRRGDEALRRRLDQALRAERAAIERILDEYGIPRV